MFTFVYLLKPNTTSYKKISSINIYTRVCPAKTKSLQTSRTNTSKVLKKNREKTRNVIQIFRDSYNVTRNTAEKVVMALYLPSAFGHVGKKGKPDKADDIYDDFVSRYKDDNADIERPNKRRPGIKRNYELRVVLFTQARKQDPK